MGLSGKRWKYNHKCKACGRKFLSVSAYEAHECVKQAQEMTEEELIQKIKELEGK